MLPILLEKNERFPDDSETVPPKILNSDIFQNLHKYILFSNLFVFFYEKGNLNVLGIYFLTK